MYQGCTQVCILLHRAGILLQSASILLHRATILLHRANILLHRASILLHRPNILLHRACILLHRASILLHRASIRQKPRSHDVNYTLAVPKNCHEINVQTILMMYSRCELHTGCPQQLARNKRANNIDDVFEM